MLTATGRSHITEAALPDAGVPLATQSVEGTCREGLGALPVHDPLQEQSLESPWCWDTGPWCLSLQSAFFCLRFVLKTLHRTVYCCTQRVGAEHAVLGGDTRWERASRVGIRAEEGCGSPSLRCFHTCD